MAKRSRKRHPHEAAERIVARNRRASFDYVIEERIEAGLVLTGSEVKSLRDGKASIAEAYATIDDDGEVWLVGAHIGRYQPAGVWGHEPRRRRKLLLKRSEIDRLARKVRERGYTLVPLVLYFRDGWAKIELGLARGRRKVDKRDTIKARDAKREVERHTRSRR